MEVSDKTDSSPTSTPRPTPKRVADWLDERGSLEQIELDHVGSCEACLKLLEQCSDNASLAELAKHSSGSLTQRFEHEPEFQAVCHRVRQLNDQTVDSEHGESTSSDTHGIQAASTDGRGDSQDASSRFDTSPGIDEIQVGLPENRYLVQRLLAAGGFSSVYLAFDQKLSLEVAIKVLRHESMRERQRFQREAKILAEIEHPNVVRVFDVGSLKNRPNAPSSELLYIVMEYVPGGTLDETIELVRNQASYESLARAVADAASGLAAAHAKGLIHRDVKPTNLLFDERQKIVKVADFGLARSAHESATLVTRTGEILGTPQFMSPEQVDAEKRTTHSSDIYSLGATLYTLLTGQPLLQGTTAAILRQIPETDPVAPRVWDPSIPQDIETICLHAIEKSPANRYASMNAFAEDLRSFAEHRPIHAHPVSAATKVLRFVSRNRSLAMSVSIALGLAIALMIGSVTAAIVFRIQNRNLTNAIESEQQARAATTAALRASIDAADQLLVSVTTDTELLPKAPGSQEISRKLLRRASDYYQAFLVNNQDNQTLVFEFARARSGLAKIALRMGELQESIEEAEAALALLDNEVHGEASHYPREQVRADTLLVFGSALSEIGQMDRSKDILLQAVGIADSVLLDRPADPTFLSKKARALQHASLATAALGNALEARQLVEQALQIGLQLVQLDPANAEYRRNAAQAEQSLAICLFQSEGLREGREHLLAALLILEPVVEDGATTLRINEMRAHLWSNLGRAENLLGETVDAEAHYERAIAQYRKLIDLEPSVPNHQWNYVMAVFGSAAVDYAVDEFQRMIDKYESIMPVLQELIVVNPENIEYQEIAAKIQCNQSMAVKSLGNVEAAIEPLETAIRTQQRIAEKLNRAPDAVNAVALTYYELASVYLDLDRTADALGALGMCDQLTAESLERQADFLPSRELFVDSLLLRADVLAVCQPAQPEALLLVAERGVAASRLLLDAAPHRDPYKSNAAYLLVTRGEARFALDDLEAATADADATMALIEEHFETPYSDTAKNCLMYVYFLRAKVTHRKLIELGDELNDERIRLSSELASALENAAANGATPEELAAFQVPAHAPN